MLTEDAKKLKLQPDVIIDAETPRISAGVIADAFEIMSALQLKHKCHGLGIAIKRTDTRDDLVQRLKNYKGEG